MQNETAQYAQVTGPVQQARKIFEDTQVNNSLMVFSHFRLWRRVWEYAMFAVSLITPVEMSFLIIFIDKISIDWYAYFAFFDVLQIIDVFIVTRTPFLKYGVFVFDWKVIIQNYGLCSFYFDVFATIPLGWIGLIVSNKWAYFFLSLNRLCRIHRVYKSYKIITTTQAYMNSFTNIYPYIVIFFFLTHAWACIFFFIAKEEGLENSWVKPYANMGFTRVQYYVVSFYYIFTTFTTVGYGYLHPNNTLLEQLMSILLMITGATIITLLIATLVHGLIDTNKSEFLLNFRSTLAYLKFAQVKPEIIKLTNEYFQNAWDRNHGYPGWEKILQEIPEGISHRIKLENCKRAFLGMQLFKNIPIEFLLMLMDNLEVVHYMPNQIIVTQESLVSELFIFNSGILRMCINGHMFATRNIEQENFVYGERHLIFNDFVPMTIQAVSYIEGWRITNEMFYSILNMHPNVKNVLWANACHLYPDDFRHNTTNLNHNWSSFIHYHPLSSE